MIITSQAITKNGKHYDREFWGGFRAGIETTGRENFRSVNLVFLYGAVEEKTNCHAVHLLADEYVAFLNKLVGKVGATLIDTPTQAGERKQVF